MSEMMGCSISIKVPLAWEGEPVVHRHISGWTDGPASRPIYEGDEYLERTVRLPVFEWFEDIFVSQWEGDEFLTVSWDGELNYGWSGDSDAQTLLEWLGANRIPYKATTDAKYEMDGEMEFYDGNAAGLVVTRTSSNAGIVLDAQEWKAINAAHDHLDDSAVFESICAAVDAHFAPSDLGACDISHLPAEPPRDEEDEDGAAD